ncbi:MAG TPA: LysR family transcriptional regulator [Polyangiaceae bacterium]|nr:LysR family transcriptional regulator [Polyangiaceae bacterium]
MVTETLELTVFHCVVKHSSYAKAAEELALSPSGVSRIVSRLEERLGARLVQRTTRKLSLTEAGAAFHARTVQILLDLADAEAEVQETSFRPRGNLRLSAPVVFGQQFIAPLLDALLEAYPELSIEFSLTDRFVDLIDEGMDLAIRLGSLPDSRLIARRLCTNQRVLIASAAYLERRGVPSHPLELVEHDCVLFTSFARPREWKLLGPDGPVTVSVSGRVASNNAGVVASSAKRGLGITVGATVIVADALRSGELVRVLSDWQFENAAIFAVYPSARQLSTKVRATVDFLAEHLKDPPSWDQQLIGVPGFEQNFRSP